MEGLKSIECQNNKCTIEFEHSASTLEFGGYSCEKVDKGFKCGDTFFEADNTWKKLTWDVASGGGCSVAIFRGAAPFTDLDKQFFDKLLHLALSLEESELNTKAWGWGKYHFIDRGRTDTLQELARSMIKAGQFDLALVAAGNIRDLGKRKALLSEIIEASQKNNATIPCPTDLTKNQQRN